MVSAMSSFDHPAAARDHSWDLRSTLGLRKFTHLLPDQERRALVEAAFTAFEAQVLPLASQLPLAVIQGDFNDANIIVGEKKKRSTSMAGTTEAGSRSQKVGVVGVIDFGDMVKSWRVNEVAIAVAYAMVGGFGKRPGKRLDAALALFTGFARNFKLSPAEVSEEEMTLRFSSS